MIRTLPDAPYSTAEAAHVIGVHEDTIRRLIKAGQLEGAFRAGPKLWRVPVAAVEAFIARRSIA